LQQRASAQGFGLPLASSGNAERLSSLADRPATGYPGLLKRHALVREERGFRLPYLASGIERQPRKKLEPSPERLLAVLHRWRDEAVKAGRTITRIALAFDRPGALSRANLQSAARSA
jgi:hypothetical protein